MKQSSFADSRACHPAKLHCPLPSLSHPPQGSRSTPIYVLSSQKESSYQSSSLVACTHRRLNLSQPPEACAPLHVLSSQIASQHFLQSASSLLTLQSCGLRQCICGSSQLIGAGAFSSVTLQGICLCAVRSKSTVGQLLRWKTLLLFRSCLQCVCGASTSYLY